MEDLRKVNNKQFLALGKNLLTGLVSIVCLLMSTIFLPEYLAPIVALFIAVLLFIQLYNNKVSMELTCMLIPYSIFFCMIAYSFTSIITNILDMIGVVDLPREYTFMGSPYIIALTLDPICFLVLLIILLRRKRLLLCIDCKLLNGDPNERGRLGQILNYESYFQLKNLIIMFGTLTCIVWIYDAFIYKRDIISKRDQYILIWLNIIGFILDGLYYTVRYVNIYCDLKENDEIITQEELADMSAKTYIRYYVICKNDVYLVRNYSEVAKRRLLDTPFITHKHVNGITMPEVANIIKDMTGTSNGELRFFFGRKSHDMERHSLLRYFFFLNGNKADYQKLNTSGEWVNFNEIKQIYSLSAVDMSQILVSDITRLATIILTQKTYDESGHRRFKIKSYRPTFSLEEIRESEYDFQDNKWIKRSIYNSDSKLYQIREWWKNIGIVKRNKENETGSNSSCRTNCKRKDA